MPVEAKTGLEKQAMRRIMSGIRPLMPERGKQRTGPGARCCPVVENALVKESNVPVERPE